MVTNRYPFPFYTYPRSDSMNMFSTEVMLEPEDSVFLRYGMKVRNKDSIAIDQDEEKH